MTDGKKEQKAHSGGPGTGGGPALLRGALHPPVRGGQAYTEDTLLSAMETAGNGEFDEDTEKKGLGTPATRAGIIEKLVKSGFAERKGKSLTVSKDGINLIAVLPDAVTSPVMTAEWENTLMQIERGEAKAQQRQAMRDGKFVGSRTPYGYRKDPEDCHRLIIDPAAAPVVRQMFQWASEGVGLNAIVRRLNEAGQQTPSYYKRETGDISSTKLLGSGSWQTRTVAKILHSEVYTGDLVQGFTKQVDHRQVPAAPEERTVVRGTHEAIVSRELFDAVQSILAQAAQRHSEKQVDAYTANPLKGKVFCACCGGSLHR